jgi:hypothetical protein
MSGARIRTHKVGNTRNYWLGIDDNTAQGASNSTTAVRPQPQLTTADAEDGMSPRPVRSVKAEACLWKLHIGCQKQQGAAQ